MALKLHTNVDDEEIVELQKKLNDLNGDKIRIRAEINKSSLKDINGLSDYIIDRIKTGKDISTASVNELIQAQNYLNIAKQAQGISGVKRAIEEYNSTLTKLSGGTTKASSDTAKLTGALEGTNVNLANFMVNAKGAEVNLKDYVVSLATAKVKTVALQAATMAMNMAISFGVSFLITKGISALSSWIDSLVVTKEEIKEAAEEAKTAINDIKSNFDTLQSSTDSIKKRFAELAQGVDNLGKANQSRGKLSTEDYNEFLDLSNQLAELFPQLTINYDDNGNAILNLSGNIDTIVSSLENLVSVQQELTNQQILEKMPDMWSGYATDLEGYQDSLNFLEKRVLATNEAIENISKNKTFEFTTPRDQVAIASNMLDTALTNMGYDLDDYKKTTYHDYQNGRTTKRTVTWDFSSLEDTEIEKLKNTLASLGSEYESSVQLAKNKIASANSEMSSYINTWLTTGSGKWNFTQMSSDMQNVVKDILINSDWISSIPDDVDASKWSEVSNWLEQKFLYAITQIDDSEIQTALVNAFNGNFTVDKLQEIIDQLINTKGFAKDNPLIIYLQTKITDKTEKVNAVKTRLNDDLIEEELDKKINSLSAEDLEIAAEISVTDGSLLSWDELIEKIEETKKLIKENSITSFDEAFNAADFADTKEELLELAKSGEITSDVLESTEEYNALLSKTGLSAEEAKQKILGMFTATEKLSAASKGLDSLSTAFNEWKDKGFVTAETLEALPDVFKEDTEKFDLFSQIVGDPTNSEAEIQQAFNDIATEYLKTQSTLGKITKENIEAYIANLKDMGIANAKEVVEEYSIAKDEFHTLLSEAYEEWTSHLQDNEQALEEYLAETDTKNAEIINVFGEEYSTDYQNWLELLQKKKEAYETYRSAIEGTSVQTPDELKDSNKTWAKTDQIVNRSLADMSYAEYEKQEKKIQELAAEYSAKLASAKFTSNSLDFTGSKDSSSSSSNSDKDTSQTFDWIETKISRLNDALDSIKAKADNTYSLWTKRNTELANAISKTRQAIDLQSQAYTRYMQEADSVGLSDNYKRLVQNGAIDIDTISDETLKDKISEYQTWYEKAQECLKTQEDLNSELNELKTQKFDNIKSEYDAVINRMQSAYDLLKNQITLLSSSGDYNTLRNKQSDIVNKLQSERNALADNLNSSGIQQYTEEWYNLISQIDDLDNQISDAESTLKDIDNLQFDNLKEAFDFDTSVLEHGLHTIQNKIDLLELKGQFANESYYNGMIEYTQKELDTLKNERTQLQNILNNTLYKQGTSEWNDMYSALMDIDEEIDSMTSSLIDFNNAIRDLNWEIFEYLEESLNRITEEMDYYVELLSKKHLFDENGQITNYGTTSMALHAAAYDVYKQKAQDYYEEVQDLQKQLVNGAGRDVLEQYNDRVKAHQDAILAAEDEKQSILDLIEDGYNAQLDALQRLIDKKKDQLNAEKNLYDYQKSISEKADNISSLEKQKLAYEGDTSEEAMSKIQQIKVQLEEAKADLKESEYEQYLSDTEIMLDQLTEDYKEWMDERLNHSDELIAQVIGEISSKGELINNTLEETSDYYGTFISESLSTIFNSDSPFTQSLTSGLSNVSGSLNSGLGGVSTSIAGTTTAINNLVSHTANLVNADASKTNAGSNVAANNNSVNNTTASNNKSNTSSNIPSDNSSVIKPSTNTSNANKNTTATGNSSASNSTPSSTSSSSNTAKTGKSLLDSILISKKDYYPKGSLNIDTSVIDRLKYKDKDSSFSARAMYWNKIFGGTYTGSSAQNTKLLNYLKSNGYKSGTSNAAKGYHWTQEEGEEIIYRTSDGAVLTPLGKGDMVFDNESSHRLWELSKNPEAYMKKYNIDPSTITATIPQPTLNISIPDFGNAGSTQSSQINVGDISVNLELPNITDYTDFRNQLIKDGTFEKAMFTSINHALTGKGTSLDKLRYTR